MNYIKEINAFYNLMEREPLSASAVSLWNTLLHINNKAAWADEFTVPGMILKVKGGLTDSSFKRARKELVDRGFIEHQTRGRNLAPIYKMKRLHLETSLGVAVFSCQSEQPVPSNEKPKLEDELDPQENRNEDHKMNHPTNLATDPLNKQDKTKQNERNPFTPYSSKEEWSENYRKESAIHFYEENIGSLSPFIAEGILNWVNEVGEELVIEAMKRTVERGKFNFGYVVAILKSWDREGIQSMETLRQREKQKRNAKARAQYGRNARNNEVVPDWFLERKKKSSAKVEDANDKGDVAEMLKEYLEQQVG